MYTSTKSFSFICSCYKNILSDLKKYTLLFLLEIHESKIKVVSKL